MAARGLWHKALLYYLRVAETEELSPEIELELAEIYVELEQPDKALEILHQIPPGASERDQAAILIKRAMALKEERKDTPKPPKVTR